MKKILLFAAFVCICAAGFSQAVKTSLKDATVVGNNAAVSFNAEQSYFYLLNNSKFQVSKTDGVFKVADFYEVLGLTGGEPRDEYEGEVAFTFSTVLTDEGYALKIDSKVTNSDGVNLKGATIEVKEDAKGVEVGFKVKGCSAYKAEKAKTFKVLVG